MTELSFDGRVDDLRRIVGQDVVDAGTNFDLREGLVLACERNRVFCCKCNNLASTGCVSQHRIDYILLPDLGNLDARGWIILSSPPSR